MKYSHSLTLLICTACMSLIFSGLSYSLFYKVQSPDGNILYFLYLPVLILIYLIFYQTFDFFNKKNINIFYSLAIFKVAELGFYSILISFVLISHTIIYFILLCLALNLLLYLYQKHPAQAFYITPNFDLVFICVLAFFISYAPEINKLYPQFSIQKIKYLSNGILAINLIILVTNLINHIYSYKKSKSKLIGKS